MITYQKFFVSQHFGKSLGTVELGDAAASVTIALARSEDQHVKFSFCPARLAQFVREEDGEQETALRIAIAQAHKEFIHEGMDALTGAEHPLALETAPWIGDLTEVQYGGATSGYETLAASIMTGKAGGAAISPA